MALENQAMKVATSRDGFRDGISICRTGQRITARKKRVAIAGIHSKSICAVSLRQDWKGGTRWQRPCEKLVRLEPTFVSSHDMDHDV